MSSLTFSPGPSAPRPSGRAPGATTVGGARTGLRIGEVLHAVKVFAGAAFSVVVLGEYAQEAGVRRR
ncbi:hypothetical protein [Streptomyces sp. NPDC054887]